MICFKWLLVGHVLLSLDIVLADWSYPPIKTPEGPFNTEEEAFLEHIVSDNPRTARYAISGDDVDKFRIVEATGELYKTTELDRETKEKYVVTATCYDVDGGATEDPIDLEIAVIDINDNPPVFKIESQTGEVAEAHPTGFSSQPFMTVQATDLDSGNYGKIVYEIIAGSDTPTSADNRFSINEETGQVRLQVGDLNYEQNREVTFKVLAKDNLGRLPSNSATAVITVKVLDSNDEAPKFDPMPDRALSELSALNKPLYDIYASDGDEGINKKVYFEITSGNVGETFTIESKPSDSGKSLGQLQLLKPLDFESEVTSYTLTIKAYNKEAVNSADDRYSTTSTLKVTVTDENEPPIFRNTPYSAILTEGPSPNEPVPIVKVEAEDIDFNGNQSVTYSVNDPNEWFQVDPKTGQVSRIGAVDRESDTVTDGVYHLRVVATDNYDHGPTASGTVEVDITINDINDSPPRIEWGSNREVVMCEKPVNKTVTVLETVDPDSPANGPKFFYKFVDSDKTDRWGFSEVDDYRQEVVAKFSDYGLNSGSETVQLVFTITDSGSPPQIGTSTLTVTVCKCGDNGEATCKDAVAAGFPVAIIIAIIALLLLIAILIFAVITYKRRQAALLIKEPLIDDEDDVRETVQVYQEEGGEEDQDAYDLSALRAPLMEDPTQPIRKEVPLQQAPRQPRTSPPDDIANIIGEAKDQADGDPSAPPFDSLLVFDYEGAGSDAGSLSSINTATTDGSMDYDYLNDWGPRFKRLADMYNDGSESE